MFYRPDDRKSIRKLDKENVLYNIESSREEIDGLSVELPDKFLINWTIGAGMGQFLTLLHVWKNFGNTYISRVSIPG